MNINATTLAIIAAVLLGLATMAGLAYGQRQYQKGTIAGYDSAVAEVRKQDAKAADAAGRTRDRVVECYEQGKDWDAASGRCGSD